MDAVELALSPVVVAVVGWEVVVGAVSVVDGLPGGACGS